MGAIVLSDESIVLVDDEDVRDLQIYNWHRHGEGYATRGWLGGGRNPEQILMHRQLLGFPDGDVDHEDRDPLNNQRANLRLATRAQNNANGGSKGGSSRYKGVCWIKRERRWLAQIMIGRKHHYIGTSRSEEEAARMYDAKARETWGEFAWLNFPEER